MMLDKSVQDWYSIQCDCCNRGARDVIVIVVGNGHGGMSSNPGRDWVHFT